MKKKKLPGLKPNCDYDTLIQKLGKDDNVTKRKFRELIQSRRPGKHEEKLDNLPKLEYVADLGVVRGCFQDVLWEA